MSSQLSLSNFSSPNILENLQLDADVAAAASVVQLVNVQALVAQDFLLIGRQGSESSELRQVQSVAGLNVTLTAPLSNKHSRYEPVTKLFGDKMTVKRAPNTNNLQPLDAAFIDFTSNLIAIDFDQMSTLFTDFNGSSDFWYKYIYTNSITSGSTPLSGSSAARGDGYGDLCSTDLVREKAGFKRAQYISDSTIDQHRRAAQDMINGALTGFYNLPFTRPIPPSIEDLCARMAAGKLLLDQYGIYDTRNTASGQALLDGAVADLKAIVAGTYTILDGSGASIKTEGSSGMNGYPNAASSAVDRYDGGTAPMTRIGERY